MALRQRHALRLHARHRLPLSGRFSREASTRRRSGAGEPFLLRRAWGAGTSGCIAFLRCGLPGVPVPL